MAGEYPSMGHLIDLATPLAPQIGKNMGNVLGDHEMVEFIMSAYRTQQPATSAKPAESSPKIKWYKRLLGWYY